MPADADGNHYSDDEEEPDFGSFESSRFNPGPLGPIDNVAIIQNLPVIPKAKEEKLKGVIAKLVKNIGTVKTIEMPFTAEGKSYGLCFLEMENRELCDQAVSLLDKYKLDKAHVFSVISMKAFDEIMQIPEEFVPPAGERKKAEGNLISWLMDEQARDQYCITNDDVTGVYWNDVRDKPKPIMERSRWTESFTIWSPKGTYLATLHKRGVKTWGFPGGTAPIAVGKFMHDDVTLIDFSPCERYLATWSNPSGFKKDAHNLIVWDVKAETKLRGFTVCQETVSWPVLLWNHDGSFMAQQQDDGSISVYELPSMQPACTRIKVADSKDVCWSPTQNVLAYWLPEEENQPTSVILQEIPSKVEIKKKVLFNVEKCSFFWQTNGEYLAVQVDRESKSGKTTYTNFELFRTNEKDCPVEVLEFKESAIHGFAWEPKGTKFCVLHGEPPRLDVSFYTMGNRHEKDPKVNLLHKLEKRAVNEIRWSPKGQCVILAGLRNLNGQLQWWNCTDRELTMAAEEEHFMCTDIEWDPTGRYVATSVQALRHNMENGFVMWTGMGRQIHKVPKERFQKLLWRPRPKCLLTDKQEKSIAKDLRKWRVQFEEVDNAIAAQASSEEAKARQTLLDDFDDFERKWARRYKEMASDRADLRGYASDDEEYVTVEELYEEVLETQNEIMTGQ